MQERRLTCTELRVYLRDLANSVAASQERVTVSRHGFDLIAVVSLDDLEFLRKHKPEKTARPVPEPVELTEEDKLAATLERPEYMDRAEVQRIVDLTMNTEHFDLLNWRIRAKNLLGVKLDGTPSRGPPAAKA